jgi:AbrB family looped-hinge helix DNA binding protein
MTSTISSKGQITVPAKIREKLGLVPGTEVEFVLKKNGVFLRKGARDVHPVDRAFGLVELSAPVDEILAEMRGAAPKKKSVRGKR